MGSRSPAWRNGRSASGSGGSGSSGFGKHPGARERAARSLCREARPWERRWAAGEACSSGTDRETADPGAEGGAADSEHGCQRSSRGDTRARGAREGARPPRPRQLQHRPEVAGQPDERRRRARAWVPACGGAASAPAGRGGGGGGGGSAAGPRAPDRRAARPGPQAAAPAPRADAKRSPPPDPPPRRRITHLFVGEIAPARPSD